MVQHVVRRNPVTNLKQTLKCSLAGVVGRAKRQVHSVPLLKLPSMYFRTDGKTVLVLDSKMLEERGLAPAGFKKG